LRHGLAHRRAADAEILRQRALIEPDFGAAAVHVHADDDAFERRIGLVLEVERGVDRLQPRPLDYIARGIGQSVYAGRH
jgi:hypothetical protein